MQNWKSNGRISDIVYAYDNAYDEIFSYTASIDPVYQEKMSRELDFYGSLLQKHDNYLPLYKSTYRDNNILIFFETYKKIKSIEIIISINPVTKKCFDFDNVTGTIGLKGLVSIYRQIPYIIKYIKENIKWCTEIICSPTDNKRIRAYKPLEKIGFVYNKEEYVYKIKR